MKHALVEYFVVLAPSLRAFGSAARAGGHADGLSSHGSRACTAAAILRLSTYVISARARRPRLYSAVTGTLLASA